jgi:NADH dehydrogenase
MDTGGWHMKIAVTGAFGYSGRYIAKRLLEAGHFVVTLTNSLRRDNPFGEAVQAIPFHFDEPDRLRQSLQGVDSLINTYWVRFNHRLFSIDQAVANSRVLFQAAKDAGVRRIVHISITHPDINSNLPYFRGKAELELALQSSGISHCILRPTVLFGKEDILINNIAWALRHLPVFALFGSGDFRLQPIYVDDLASAAVEQAVHHCGSEVINAIGPETFTYRSLIDTIRQALGLKRLVVSLPPRICYWSTRALGPILGDLVITREEIQGLMENRLYVDAPSLGTTRLSEWIELHKNTLGREYTSEIARRVDRTSKYKSN